MNFTNNESVEFADNWVEFDDTLTRLSMKSQKIFNKSASIDLNLFMSNFASLDD